MSGATDLAVFIRDMILDQSQPLTNRLNYISEMYWDDDDGDRWLTTDKDEMYDIFEQIWRGEINPEGAVFKFDVEAIAELATQTLIMSNNLLDRTFGPPALPSK